MNIQEEISKFLISHDTVNVLLSGTTCSGKTTLANSLKKSFQDRYQVTIVAQDDYFKNPPDVPKTKEGYLADSIEAFLTDEFKQDVQKLLTDGVAIMPRYDITTNTRISKNKIVRAGNINIFEGLHTIYLLGDLDNCIKVFLDTDIDVCVQRRIARDTSNFGVPEARILKYWNDCVKPMCEQFVFPQKKYADIIINQKGGEFNES
jgi:uridine kinase